MVLTMGLRRSLALDANAEALVSNEARLTRREMVDRIARLASVLRNLGMQDADRVAMLARHLHQGQVAVVKVAHGGHEGNAGLAAQMIAQVLDGVYDFHGKPLVRTVGEGCRSLRPRRRWYRPGARRWARRARPG